MKSLFRFVFAVLAVVLSAHPSNGLAQSDDDGKFSADQLDQLVAPIALYPDALLSQTMMAATYPLEIVQASRWREANSSLQGAALDKAMEAQPWDPSVKSLVPFPETLRMLNDNLDWTQDLGDAVLGQQDEVMLAVQRMRAQAKSAGNLTTTPQQTVVVEKETIIIKPAAPEVVYVPIYNPVVIYGPQWRPYRWYYPCYGNPPSYWYWGRPVANAVTFTAGFAAGALMFGACDWNHRNFYVRPSCFNHPWYRGYHNVDVNINRNVSWNHNPVHRHGVQYHNTTVRNQYNQNNIHINNRPGYDRPVTRPGNVTRPSVDRPVTLPATRPDVTRPGTRPGNVTRPSVDRPTTLPATRPDVTRPATLPGNVTRPSVDRPTTLPATRPDVTRPSTLPGNATRPSVDRPNQPSRPPTATQRPSTRPSVDRPAPTTRPSVSRPAPATRPTTSAQRPATRPSSSGAMHGSSSGSATRSASARGAHSSGSGGGGASRSRGR